MPRATWEIKRSDIDNFDRDAQYKPYTGPIPPSGAVFQWKVKILKYFPGTKDKNPQLRIGLELVPRNDKEKKYKGYFLMTFRAITPKTQFNYVPFLDAIDVSASDFIDRTQVNSDGDIQRIGRWRNDGEQLVLAQIRDSEDQNGNPRKDIGWIGELEVMADDELDEEIDEDDYLEEEDEEGYDEELEEEDEEPEPPRKARSTGRTNARRSSRSRRTVEEDEPF